MGEARELFIKGLEMLRISYTEEQLDAFSLFLAELKKWNRAYNLTGLQTDADIVIKHFLDSLLFHKVLPGDIRTVADIGSGAGFPGIPMKIMQPELGMALVEPSQKKAQFLAHIQRTLRLDGLRIINMRVEDVHGELFDAAVTRALFSIHELIEKAERILKENGMLILGKGPKVGEELRDIIGRSIRMHDIVLPIQNSVRHLVVIGRLQVPQG
jgi:16S rRNA (guanine527-N7)-methyltransferase